MVEGLQPTLLLQPMQERLSKSRRHRRFHQNLRLLSSVCGWTFITSFMLR